MSATQSSIGLWSTAVRCSLLNIHCATTSACRCAQQRRSEDGSVNAFRLTHNLFRGFRHHRSSDKNLCEGSQAPKPLIICQSSYLLRRRLTIGITPGPRDWLALIARQDLQHRCQRAKQEDMSVQSDWTFEVEPARPAQEGTQAAGPVYRSTGARDGPPALAGASTCYELFHRSVQLYADRPCLGSRKSVDGQAQPFTYMTYAEAGNAVSNIGSAMQAVGVNARGRAGVFGANSPEWMIALQVLCHCLRVLLFQSSTAFDQCAHRVILSITDAGNAPTDAFAWLLDNRYPNMLMLPAPSLYPPQTAASFALP